MISADGVLGVEGLDWGTLVSLAAAVLTLASAIVSSAASSKSESTAETFSTAHTQANDLTKELIGTVRDALKSSQSIQAEDSVALRQQTQRLASLEAKVERLLDRPSPS